MPSRRSSRWSSSAAPTPAGDHCRSRHSPRFDLSRQARKSRLGAGGVRCVKLMCQWFSNTDRLWTVAVLWFCCAVRLLSGRRWQSGALQAAPCSDSGHVGRLAVSVGCISSSLGRTTPVNRLWLDRRRAVARVRSQKQPQSRRELTRRPGGSVERASLGGGLELSGCNLEPLGVGLVHLELGVGLDKANR